MTAGVPRTSFKPTFTLAEMEAFGSVWTDMSPAAFITVRALYTFGRSFYEHTTMTL